MEDKLYKAWQSAGKYYDLPDFDTFKEDMKDEGKLHRFHESLGKYYDVPDYDTFKADMWGTTAAEQRPTGQAAGGVDNATNGTGQTTGGAGVTTTSAGEMVAQGQQAYKPVKPGDRQDIAVYNTKGDMVRSDTATNLGGGKVGIVQVENPYFTPATTEEEKQRYYFEKASTLDQLPLEPNEFGEWVAGWQRGSRVQQLDKTGVRFMNMTGAQGSDEFDSARGDAEKMNDSQLVQAFNALSRAITDPDGYASTREGYADATRLKAYALELHARDLGAAHDSELTAGRADYLAAMGDEGVKNEIAKQEQMPWEQRRAYLAKALYRTMTSDDQDAKRVLLAGAAIRANETGRQLDEVYPQIVGEVNNENQGDIVAQALADAEAEGQRLDEAIRRRMDELAAQDAASGGSIAQALAGAESGPGGGMGGYNSALFADPELSMLWAARHQVDERLKHLNRQRQQLEGRSGAYQFATAAWDALTDPNTLMLDLSNLKDMSTMGLYGKKGGGMTGRLQDARQAMLSDTALANEIGQMFKDSAWQRWGDVTGYAVPYLMEFYLTGGFSGIAESVTKGLTKLGTTAAGNWIKGHVGDVGRMILRNTGIMLGDLTAAMVMENTIGLGHTGADIMHRAQGDVMRLGDGAFMILNDKPVMEAILKGETAQLFEYYTEKMGAHLDGLMGKAGQVLGLKDLSNYFKWMTGKDIHALATNALRRGGMNEFPSEVIEEEANLLLNALFVKDNTFDLGPLKELANQFGFNFSVDKESEDYKRSIFNPETQGDIIGGMFFSIGAMRVPAAVYGTSAYYYYKHENDKAATRLQDMMGERGDELMQRIDECPNDQIGKLYLSIMTDDSLNDAQARAAVDYINTLMQVRGRNLADMKDAEDKAAEARAKGEQPGQSDAAKDNEAFAEGYNAEGGAREEVQSDLQSAEQRLTDMGFDMSTFEGWTGDAFEKAIKGQEGTYSEEELSAIREYFRAKGADAGMQQRVEDDIDTLVQQESDLVDKQTNQGTGMVHRAVLNNGQEVYVTGGQLVMTGDGTMIDTEASDESLFVYNPATGQPEQYNPSDFQSVDDPISPEQLKARAANDARMSVEQKANDDKNGVLPFQVGDTYDILMNGQPATVTVVEDQGNNVAVQRAGSAEAEIVPKRVIQAAADNMRKAKRTAQMPATLPQRRTQDNTAATGRVDNATDRTPVTPVAPANTQSQAPALPMDEKTGEPVWNKTTPEQGYNHLAQSGMITEDIGTMIDDRIAQADAAIEKAAHGGTMDQRLQARQSKNYWEAVKALHQAAADNAAQNAAQGTAQPGTASQQRPTGQTAATTTPAGAPAGTVRIDASQSQTMPTGYVAVNADGTRAEDRGQMGVRSEDRDYFLRTMSPRVLDLLDKVAKGLGWKIRLYNGTVADERGMYLNGVVWVNRRTTAKELAQWILGHEMTHGMGKRTNQGAAFKSYIRLANEYRRKVWDERYGEGFYEQYIKNTIEAYKKHLKAKNMDASQVNRAYIEEEIACDVTGDMVMNNPEMLGKLFSGVDSAAKKKGIIDMIVDFLDYLKSKLPFRSKERKALEDLSKRLNNLYRDAKAQTNIAKATARDEGTTIDNNDGEGSGGSFSITGNAEGSGFVCSETVMEVWRVPQPDGTYKEEEHWVKKPLLDSEGNVVFRMGEKEFSGKNPITVDDLKSNPDTILNYMLADALRAGTINETKADQVRQQYADMLNLYLEKGMATEEGNGFENLEKKWLWVGETVFRTVASNSDEQYSYSIDITKVCKKNEAVIRAISAMQVKTGYGVTPAQILEIYEETDSQGLQVPCPVCYVFSRYINNGKYATAIVNGMKKYGKYLPGQPDAKPVEWWVKEMKDAQARAEKMKTPLKNANDDVKVILQQIDTLCREITSGKLSAEEAESKRRHVRALDQRYRAALDVISQEAIPRWIKSFVIEGSEQGGWRMREDAALPENMDDFTLHALDIRKTASAMEKYPALTRYRRAGGSAGGKEITFASNNELGTIAMGLGITKSRLDDYPNYYQLAAEAETEEERQALLQKARERFDNARLYAQRQTLRGGQRMWSWSDNIESLSSDVASNLMQLELLGGALQTYSKQLEGVKMVAAMNGYVNASLMGYGDGIREVGPDDIDDNGRLSHDILDVNNKGRERIIANAGSPVYHNEADGKDYVLVFDDVVGIDPFGHNGKRGLFSLNEEYDRAGNILVGMNDIHVRAAMADPRVFFIIPWHASGMSNHILQQMFNILGVDMDTFVSTDYTKMQEETNYLLKKDDGSPKKKVPKEVEDFWDSHTFEDEFACGTGHIENGDRNGGLSDSQKHYRALRDAIFDGAVKEGTEEYDQIMADEFLSQVYRQVTTLVDDGKMTEKDKEFIYPYEYWQMTEIDENGNEVPARVENADVNGRRYVEYCRRMGFKPKFTGKFDDKTGYSPEGNFADDPGYWKLLIDRRMYDRRGNYQGLTPVDSSGLDSSMYDPDQTQEEFNVTEVATNEGAEKIADTVYQRDIDRTGSMPAPNLDMTMDEAVAKYKDVTALQASLIKAENDALKAADVAKEKAAKAREKAAQDVDGRKAKSVARAQESARKAIEAAKQAAARVDEIAEQLGTVRDDIAQYPDSTDEPKFSIADRTLMGMHNITADKLRSAIRLGGLANPSMAVVDTEVGGFTNFGEISLIPSADLIASRTGGNAGTWAADAYSPRFPETHRRLGKGGDKKMRAWVKGLKMRQEMEYNTEEQFNDYYNGFSIRDNALVYPFLYEKGLSGEVDYTRHMKVDQRLEDDIQAANGDHYELLKRFDEDADFRKKLTDIVVGDEVRKIDRKEGESFQEFRDRRREWAKRYRESWTDENGDLLRNLADDELWKQCRAYKEDGKFDESRTLDNAEKYIRDHGMEEEYQQYFEQKMQELGAEIQVYAGSDSQGRSKYKPVSLEQVSRMMKKQGRAGGEGGIFADSPGVIRAKLLTPMKTLDQIRAKKDRLVSHEAFEQFRENYQNELREYADVYARGSMGALADIITSGNMAATAKRYNIDLDADAVAELTKFKNRVRSMPTEYFETKFERPVMLDEFRKAIVPDNLPLDLYGALQDAGLDVVEYPAGDNAAREKATLDAVKAEEDMRFSISSGEAAEIGDLGIRFSLRTKPAPKKTRKAYKLMRLVDGKLYPLFIGNNEEMKLHAWYDADSPALDMLTSLKPGDHLLNMETGETMTWDEYAEQHVPKDKNGKPKRGKPNVDDIHWANENGLRFMHIEDKAGSRSENDARKKYGDTRLYYNWGINGSKDSENGEGSASLYALRPGLHTGAVCSMPQIGYDNPDGGTMRLDNQVWVEVEMADDVDYQSEAESNASRDIPTHIPVDGNYRYATNPTQKKSKSGDTETDKQKGDWYVTGAMKITKILSDEEADEVVREYNKKYGTNIPLDYRRRGGRVFNAETMSLEEPVQSTGTEDRARFSISEEEREAQTHSANFKKWFGDWENDPQNASKVVDEEGRPLVVYHANREGSGFYEFDTSPDFNGMNYGSHFGTKAASEVFSDPKAYPDAKTYAVYLNLRNPLEVVDYFADDNSYWANLLIKLAKENNIDDPEINAVVEDIHEKWPWIDGTDETYSGGEHDADRENSPYQLVEIPELYKAVRKAAEMLGFDGFKYENLMEDAGSYSYVAFRPEQIKSAEAVTYDDDGNAIPSRRRFTKSNPDIRFSLAPTFYSNAARAVEGVKQEKAKAEQWKAMLMKAGGIKAGEDKWMGLSTWLDEHKGETLTKDEVRQFVADNGIQMEETHYGDVMSLPQQEAMESLQKELDQIAERKLKEQPLEPNDAIIAEAYDMAWEEMIENHGGDDFNMAFEMEQMPDGTFTIQPTMDWNDEISDAAKYFLGIDGSEASPEPINTTRERFTTDGLKNKREIAFVVPGVEPYQEHDEIHFGPENQGRAIMWVRFGETTDTDGNRVLVIDEIQSNRHQDAREKGYADPKAVKAFNDWMDAKAKEFGVQPYQVESRLSDEEYHKMMELANAAKYDEGAVPAAPFEKNWHEVAMKRMLRLAAEEGFDKVAWTTGAQQADRYNIRNVVEDLYYKKNEDGTYNISVQTKDRRGHGVGRYDNYGVQTFPNQSEADLSNLLGKEVAQKIVEGKGRKGYTHNGEKGWTTFKGNDLKIGGEGMKAFYDGMLPQFMNKYGKRWGVKTGEVTLDTPGKETMHSVDVNEDMKRSVMEDGQPLFSLATGEGRLSQRERDYTANVLKKLRKAGVNVQLATDEEAQRVLDVAEQVDRELMRGWHGSGADFDAFDHSHMGEGEGAQAYGWGTYITEVEGIARQYAGGKPSAATIIKLSNSRRAVQVLDTQVQGMKKLLIENTRNLENTKRWIDEAKKELADFIKRFGADSDEVSDWHRQRDEQMEFWQDDADSYKRGIKSIKQRLPKYEKLLQEAKDELNNLEEKFNESGGRFLYEVSIPENNGSNYLPYDQVLSEETSKRLVDAIKPLYEETRANREKYIEEIAAIREPAQQKFGDDWLKSLPAESQERFEELIELQTSAQKKEADLRSVLVYIDAGDELLRWQSKLEKALGKKETSEFLSGLGYVGVEYPAMFRSGGREDGAKNYVIFNEADAKIVNKTEFLKTSDGTVYGWHDNEGIHLTEAGLNPNTPMHEYTHGLMAMLKEREPEKYQQIVEALKDSEVWQEVLNDELYSSIRDDVDAVASEVASRLSGRESERRANESMSARIKRAIQELWEAVAEWFGVKSPMTADRIARMTLRELERGTNPDGDGPGGGTNGGDGPRFSLSGDGTVEEYNKAVNMTGRTFNVGGREVKPGITRYNFQEAFQDAILAVKKLQQVVERHFGIKLPTRENAWMYENRLSSINMHERKSFIDKVYEPMMKIADRIMKRGVKEKELNAYLICKHGLERNLVFAARDAQAEADEITRNGGTPDIQQLIDKYRQRDYSGLTGVTGIEGDIADIEAEAQRIVDEFEQRHGALCNELWDAIRKATQWSLRKSYQSGMMSAATFDHVRNMFQYYVPLRGWSETTAEDVYSYMMGEHGAFNGVLKKAEGRTSVADDPLATIGNMAESALMQGNKNLLKQHLLRMAQNHPTDVCQVRDVWLVEGPGGVWEPHWPNIPDDATPDEIDQILQDHENDMMQLEAGGGAKRVRNNLDIPYRIDPRHVPEHAVVAKVAGIDHVVYINGNPRAAQAINGQTGAGRGTKSGFSRLIDFIFGDMKRFYSSVLTSLNINFSGANFVRDLPHAYAMTFVKYGPLKAAEYIARSFQVIPWVFKNQLGKTGTSKIDRYFQEFLSSGSVTGYAHINDVDAWKADNKRRFARLSALGKARVAVPRALGEVINAIGWFSETLELIPRFTAFLVERESGKDIATATKAAKDITTNFNKKGSEVTPGVWGAVANTLRYMKMFFNPIVQGMYQFVDVAGQAKENKWVGPRMVLATMHLPILGAIVPYLNQFLLEALGGDDDDDYWLLNEYTRRNNVCIFTGNGYVKIPIAPVFRELYGMGEVVATRHAGKADNEKTVIDLIDQLRTMGSVEGQSSYNEWSLARFLLPEHFAPLIDVMNNENFTGGPIYYDNNYKEYAPEYTKAKKSTWSPLVAASKWLNEMMGGDEDIAAGNSGKWMNPAVWQHLITNVGGGFAQLAGDVVSGITDITEGKEIDASNMPVLKRFYSNSSDERAQWARFGIYKDFEKDYTMAKEKYQALDKRGLSLTERADEMVKFAESHPRAAAIYAVWEGGIKGADIPARLEKLGKDDPAYWDLVKEAVGKAEKAMNSGYVRAWEQKRKDRPDSMSDKELNERFDKSDNDSIRHIMADEISKRAGSQDYYGRDAQATWSDKSVAAWEAYQDKRTSDDIKADAELSNLLKVDDDEKDKARIKMLGYIKDELNKIRRGKDATSRSAGVKGLGEGDDERIMEELRAARKQLIEDLKSGSAEQAYRNLERRTMRLGLRKKAKEL